MNTAEVRRRFVAHFEAADHTAVPSAPLVTDDPNLLFVNAGMVPFKPYLLGQEPPPYPRAVSVQKCIRTLDIEQVGKTTRHGTFFQMAGNFSFGDYLKDRAIELAWSLVTGSVADGGLGFDPDHVWVTVLDTDTASRAAWKKITGIPDERIQNRGRADNYWTMGVPGPGGPCSEIYIDRGPQFGPDGGPAVDEDRFLEIWNLVFMQDQLSAVRASDDFDVLGPLPNANIDTGMGLERVSYLLQGKENIYEIDEVFPVIAKATALVGTRYGASHIHDVRLRVVADHVRSSLMLLGEGLTPGNEGRNYVLRRLLRRAVRSMHLLGYTAPVLPELLPVSLEAMVQSYPELQAQFAQLSQVAYREEEAFRSTLGKGTRVFELAVAETKRQRASTIAAPTAFRLHDTYGFPIDVTLEMAADHGLNVDVEGFRGLMAEHRRRAQADARGKKDSHLHTALYREVLVAHGPTDWLAYTTLSAESQVLALYREGVRIPTAEKGAIVDVVLDRTPFYAESGGQIADAGTLTWDGGKAEVLDVQRPLRDLFTHQVRVIHGELIAGTLLLAEVDNEWRFAASQAHSATHVVHAAVREVLGPGALQSGSYNRPGYLRLDFTWDAQLSPQQLHCTENTANRAVQKNLPVSASIMPLTQARSMGALALFGETYGEDVRVVEIDGPWSRELCGGTHVETTSQIGTIALTSQSAVGSGVRRIEAHTGLEGFRYLAKERDLVHHIVEILKSSPEAIPERIEALIIRVTAAEKKLKEIQYLSDARAADKLVRTAQQVGSTTLVLHHCEGRDTKQTREFALHVCQRLHGRTGVVVIISTTETNVNIAIAVTTDAQQCGIAANELFGAIATQIKARGGGNTHIAQGTGKRCAGVGNINAVVKNLVSKL